MADPLEYYGAFTTSRILLCRMDRVEKVLGRPDAIHRFAAREAPLWRCQRVYEYLDSGKLLDGPSDPPELYSLAEAARFVGVTIGKLRQILGNKQAPAIIAPLKTSQEPTQLWPEQWLLAVRKLIASGEIEIRRSSLTRPKMGARLCSPRHRLTVDQNRETEQLRKVCPLDFVIW
jgi:hypothetical protein